MTQNNKYANGKIYQIIDNAYTKCYIGSTCQHLSSRMGAHRRDYKRYLLGNFNLTTSFLLFQEFGLENCKIELIEEYPCKNKEELLKKEGFYIKLTNCVNKAIAGRTKKEWTDNNKDKIKEWMKEYAEQNKEKILERSRQWKQIHKDEIREHYKQNKEKYNQQSKDYRAKNQDKIKEYKHQVIVCDLCGSQTTRHSKHAHQKTKKCIKLYKDSITSASTWLYG